jgi:hypothetical protein
VCPSRPRVGWESRVDGYGYDGDRVEKEKKKRDAGMLSISVKHKKKGKEWRGKVSGGWWEISSFGYPLLGVK